MFQRFKSLAQLRDLPKHNDDSAKAWLYGKVLAAMLVEKLTRHALAIAPWRHDLEAPPTAQRVRCLPIRSEPSEAGHRTRHPVGPGAQRMARDLTVAGRTTSSTVESGVQSLQVCIPSKLALMPPVLQSVADSLLAVACAMLRDRTLCDASRSAAAAARHPARQAAVFNKLLP